MPEIAAFVVIGLIPLSAPASWTHCVSFCSPQEGRTGASVFELAMSKSALLVLSQKGCAHTRSLSLPVSLECLFLTENNMSSSVSAEGLHNTKPFHVWMRVCDGCHILAKFSRAVSLRWCLPGCCCQSEKLLLLILFHNIFWLWKGCSTQITDKKKRVLKVSFSHGHVKLKVCAAWVYLIKLSLTNVLACVCSQASQP